MLSKLIKYEFKSTARLYILLYCTLIVVSIINSFLMPQQAIGGSEYTIVNIIEGFMLTVYVLLIIAIGLTTFVAIIQRFYKNLLGDSGYLMFTLPVSTDQHILSKLIVSIVWVILSVLTILLSFIIVIPNSLEVLSDLIRFLTSLGFNTSLWILGILVVLFSSMVCAILQFYTAIAIGPHVTKNRLLGSFIAYIVIYTIAQIIATVFLTASFGLNSLTSTGNLNMTSQVDIANTMGFQILIFTVVLNIVFSVACYLITRYMLKNKLNLE